MSKPILLIEDNPMDVDLTKRAFRKCQLNHPIEVARDGEEALNWICKWEQGAAVPALVLLDLHLPKVPGLKVLQVYKSHPIYRTIPVLVLTTSKNDNDIQQAYQYGVNSYIVKPIQFETFARIIADIKHYWLVLNNLPLLSEP